ncbi:EAL domain-containing protein [Bowmanella sp. JS7-9]|uniref:EAL domain-containing response regulator n=1 Tax=Alteromonadaceae TaxID=72275 RepID=UPI00103EDB5E|nr:EAL domain-containing protein [Bowmanella sp. JS7-9]TBX25741.1 hypothetical protein TK45_03365 [Bowmanella sp. JS7-9]
MTHDEFEFMEEPVAHHSDVDKADVWTILSVEDNPAYQQSLNFALSDLRYRGKKLQVLNANSRTSAATMISQHPEICIILLDVVMEEDDSGLRLVNTIREVLGNKMVRIVLLTGQPGMAPRQNIMEDYDIDDYWVKSKLNKENLQTIVYSNIRTWLHLRMLDEAQRGLQLIIEASQQLDQCRELPVFSDHVLATLGGLIGAAEGGIICARQSEQDEYTTGKILAASGKFSKLKKQQLDAIEPELHAQFEQLWQAKQHIFEDNRSLLYFPSTEFTGEAYLCMVCSEKPLTDQQIYMLQIFSENVQSNFKNIALFNRLSELAYMDPLLGVFNRNRLQRELNVLSSRHWYASELIVCSLEDFPSLYLTFGRDFINRCVSAVYTMLSDNLPGLMISARIGQDRLALLTNNTISIELPEQLSFQAVPVDGIDHRLPLRFGVVRLSSVSINNGEAAIHAAEHALELARKLNQTTYYFDSEVEQHAAQRVTQLTKLRQAIANRDFHIALQPKIEFATNKLAGFEALARWTDSEGKMNPPDQFIGLAEQAGIIELLDIQIVELAFAAIIRLQQEGINVPVAINVSIRDLASKHYVEQLKQFPQKFDVSPTFIELEITETEAMKHYDQFIKVLSELKNLGYRVAIDDFGTGYSSLAHITELPAEVLKIDGSFVRNIGKTNSANHVIEMIMRLGNRFNFEVVAEGVETEEQKQLLREMGCHIGQGYLFARPMPLDDVIKWSKTNT